MNKRSEWRTKHHRSYLYQHLCKLHCQGSDSSTHESVHINRNEYKGQRRERNRRPETPANTGGVNTTWPKDGSVLRFDIPLIPSLTYQCPARIRFGLGFSVSLDFRSYHGPMSSSRLRVGALSLLEAQSSGRLISRETITRFMRYRY